MRGFVALILAGALAGSAGAASPRQLAFAGTQGGHWAVYTTNTNGDNLRKLTTGGGAFESDPTWSPDGRRLAYVCRNFELCVMNADGSGKRRITTTNWPKAWTYHLDPAWSPDGDWIAYSSNEDGDYDLYLIHPDGSGKHRVTRGRRDESEPAWSPDGKLALASDARGLNDIYVLHGDGADPLRVTTSRDDEEAPAWSPDGKKLVYSQELDKDQNDLYVANADGSNAKRITGTPDSESDPAWSADGSQILYETDKDAQLYVIGTDGTGTRRLPTPKYAVLGAWRPHGSDGGPAARGPSPGRAEANARWVADVFVWAAQTSGPSVGADTPAAMRRGAKRFLSEAARVRAAFANPPSARARDVQRSMLQYAAGLKRAAPVLTELADAVEAKQQARARRVALRLLPVLQSSVNSAARGFERMAFFKTGKYWLLSAQLQ